MLARELASLHTPPLLGRKSSSAKSCASITCKLIENKRLQVHCFGHLRETGGRGSYRLVHAARAIEVRVGRCRSYRARDFFAFVPSPYGLG